MDLLSYKSSRPTKAFMRHDNPNSQDLPMRGIIIRCDFITILPVQHSRLQGTRCYLVKENNDSIMVSTKTEEIVSGEIGHNNYLKQTSKITKGDLLK